MITRSRNLLAYIHRDRLYVSAGKSKEGWPADVEGDVTKADITGIALALATLTFGGLDGQTLQSTQSQQSQIATTTAAPLAFEVVSVKPAQPGAFPPAPAFMRSGAAIRGLQIMTAPIAYMIAYAYHMEMSEFSFTLTKQPDWVKTRNYTVTFRAKGEPTRDQVREMMRTMLADRFGLQVHDFIREGSVYKLVLNKPGVLGPNLKQHLEGAKCFTQESESEGKTSGASSQPLAKCGTTWNYLPGGVIHVGLTNTTIASAGSTLATFSADGLGTRPVVDATGLSGKYDLTVEFRPQISGLLVDPEADDGGVPTLILALKEQLGLRVETGEGPVRTVIIDHISEPTPD